MGQCSETDRRAVLPIVKSGSPRFLGFDWGIKHPVAWRVAPFNHFIVNGQKIIIKRWYRICA